MVMSSNLNYKKTPRGIFWCARLDLNQHSHKRPLPPQGSVSTNSTTRAGDVPLYLSTFKKKSQNKTVCYTFLVI